MYRPHVSPTLPSPEEPSGKAARLPPTRKVQAALARGMRIHARPAITRNLLDAGVVGRVPGAAPTVPRMAAKLPPAPSHLRPKAARKPPAAVKVKVEHPAPTRPYVEEEPPVQVVEEPPVQVVEEERPARPSPWLDWVLSGCNQFTQAPRVVVVEPEHTTPAPPPHHYHHKGGVTLIPEAPAMGGRALRIRAPRRA